MMVGALFLIAPILAFDIWLTLTTGRRQWAKWRAAGNWRHAAAAVAAGVALAVFCAFFVKFTNGHMLRLQGFPVPYFFESFQDKHWVPSTSAPALDVLERATDFVTGLAAPLIPYKIAEFLRVVKEELK